MSIPFAPYTGRCNYSPYWLRYRKLSEGIDDPFLSRSECRIVGKVELRAVRSLFHLIEKEV